MKTENKTFETLIEQLIKFDHERYAKTGELKAEYAVIRSHYYDFSENRSMEEYTFLLGVLSGLLAADFISEEEYTQYRNSLWQWTPMHLELLFIFQRGRLKTSPAPKVKMRI